MEESEIAPPKDTCAHEGKKFFAASRLDPVKIRVGIKETADGFNSEREFYLWSELGCSRVARACVRAWGRVCACVRTCLCVCTCVLVNMVLGKKEEAGASIYLVCVCKIQEWRSRVFSPRPLKSFFTRCKRRGTCSLSLLAHCQCLQYNFIPLFPSLSLPL